MVRLRVVAALAAVGLAVSASAVGALSPPAVHRAIPAALPVLTADAPRLAFTDSRPHVTGAVDTHDDLHDVAIRWNDQSFFEAVGEASLADGGTNRAQASATRPGGDWKLAFVSSETFEPNESDPEVYVEADPDGPDGATAPTVIRVTCDDASNSHPVVSADGERVAYASDAGGTWDIYVATIPAPGADACAGADPVRITEGAGDNTWPAWAWDGGQDRLVFSSTRDDQLGDLYVVDLADTETVVRLTDDPGADTQPSVSQYCEETPQTWVAFTTTRFRDDGSIGVLLLPPKTPPDVPVPLPAVGNLWPASVAAPRSAEPAWGNTNYGQLFLAYTRIDDAAGDPGDVWVADLGNAYYLTELLPTVTDEDPVAARSDAAETNPTWRDRFYEAADGTADDGDDAAMLAISVHAPDKDVFDVVAADGTDPGVLADTTADVDGAPQGMDDEGPSYSPDGTRVVLSSAVVDVVDNEPAEGARLMVAAADRSSLEPLVYDRDPGDIDTDPVWSPDGTRIAFVRYRLYTYTTGTSSGGPDTAEWYASQIWVVDLAADPDKNVTSNLSRNPMVGSDYYAYPVDHLDPSWAPDNRHLAIAVVETEGPYTIAILDAETGDTYPLVVRDPDCDDPSGVDCTWYDVEGNSPAWSPDGSSIAVAALDVSYYQYSPDVGGGYVHLAGSPDGITLVAMGGVDLAGLVPDEPIELPVAAFTVVTGLGPGEEATPSWPGIRVSMQPAWSPDGAEIAFAGLSETQAEAETDDSDIYAVARDGTGLRTIVAQPGRQDEPAYQPWASLALTLAATPSSILITETSTVTATVTNTGPGRAAGTVLTLELPAGLTLVDPPPAGCAAAGAIVTCDIGVLAVAASVSVALSVRGAVEGSHPVGAVVDTASPERDVSDNTATATVAVLVPDLEVTVLADPGSVLFGDTSTVTATVTNPGSGPAADVTVSVELPAGLAPVDPLPAVCAAAGAVITCDAGDLAPGASVSFAVVVRGAAEGTHTVTVVAATTSPEPDTTDNTATTTVVVAAAEADLAVTVVLSSAVAWVGGTDVTATFTVTNTGPQAAEDVKIATGYPAVVDPTGGSVCLDGAGTCDLGTIDPGGSVVLVAALDPVDAADPADAADLVENGGLGEVTAKVGTSTKEPDTSDNAASAVLEVKRPNVRVLPAVARPGQVVLAYGEGFPPGALVNLTWTAGITVTPGPHLVGADGTIRVPILIVRHDLLGDRAIEATADGSPAAFGPVDGPMLVVPRPVEAPSFVDRG